MTDVVCLCGRYYRFTGDIGVCPRCREYASLTNVSPEEEHQMRDELDLLLSSHGQSLSTERSGQDWSDPGH